MSISKLPSNASLKQVMDKFEEISLKDFSSIDIITAPTLPTSGKEGQVCIITDVIPNKIYVNYAKPTLSETDIFVKYETMNDYDTFSVLSKNKSISLKIRNIIQISNGQENVVYGYIYINNKWKRLVPEIKYIYNEGDVASVTGGWTKYHGSGTDSSLSLGSSINLSVSKSGPGEYGGSVTARTNNKIDVTGFTKLVFEAYVTGTSTSPTLSVGLINDNGDIVAKVDVRSYSNARFELNTSNLNGNFYVNLFLSAPYNNDAILSARCYVRNMYLNN